MGSDKSANSNLVDYFGTIAGVICEGPIDEIVALVVDGATIWPDNNAWADGVVELPVISCSLQSTTVASSSGGLLNRTVSAYWQGRLQFNSPHTCKAGDKIVLAGFVDTTGGSGHPFSELNGGPYTITDVGDYTIYFTITGTLTAIPPNTAVPTGTGNMTKSIAYTVGEMVDYNGAVYTCSINHQSSLSNAPPSADWTPFAATRSANPNPYHFTVAGRNRATGASYNYGDAYLYWGTSTQTLDASGEATLAEQGHPPYRNQAVLVLKNFYFGTQLQASPNVQVIVRKTPVQTLITGSPSALDSGHQANPLAALASLITDPIWGLGQPNSLLDSTTWNTVATALYGNTLDYYLSIYLDKDLTMRQFVAQLLAYFDGILTFSAGVVLAGQFLHNAAPPAFDAAHTINYNDVVEEIAFDADGYAPTFNETVVKFQDGARAFKDAAQQYVSQWNRQVVGEPRKQVLDRPWISREQQASDYAAEYGKIAAQPAISGELVVRAEKCAAITPGTLFLLTHDALQYSVVCRCLERTLSAPPRGTATIKFMNERGVAPVPYHPTPPSPTNPTLPASEVVALYQLLQVPPQLAPDTSGYYIAALMARRSTLTRGVNVWYRQADASNFYQLGTQRGFAVAGTLAAAYNNPFGVPLSISQHYRGTYVDSSTPNTQVNVTASTLYWTAADSGRTYTISINDETDPSFNMTVEATLYFVFATGGGPPYTFEFIWSQNAATVALASATGTVVATSPDDTSSSMQLTFDDFTLADDLANISATVTADAALDNAVLLILVSAANPTVFEIFSLTGLTLSGGNYVATLIRAQYGTSPQVWVAGDLAWIIPRDQLQFYTHTAFQANSLAANASVFRLQSFTDRGEADLTDATECPDIDFTFANPFGLSIDWFSLKKMATGDTSFVASTYWYLSDGTHAAGGAIFEPGTQFQVSFGLATPYGTLSDAQLIIQGPQGAQTVWSQTFQPNTKQQVCVAAFTLNAQGTYRVFVNARDQQGRVGYWELPPYTGAGGNQETIIDIEPSGAGITSVAITPSPGGVQTYFETDFFAEDVTLTLHCSYGGASIKYQIQPMGQAPGATWITVSDGATFTLSLAQLNITGPGYGGVSVYAYSTASGNNSPVQRFDYWILAGFL